jgi:hypothetical protein
VTPAMPPITFERIKSLSCRDMQPGTEAKPVLCNRAKDHVGPHQRIRARDFTVLAEWPRTDPQPTTQRGATHGN